MRIPVDVAGGGVGVGVGVCRVVVSVVATLAFVPVTALPGLLESGSQMWWHNFDDPGQPSLATDQVNVTAVLGHSATLPCRVINLRARTVSWIRARDSAVLAVDRITITTDSRFSVNHPEETEDWQLEVREVEAGDEGTYDCQVNTHPKISTKVHLKVLSTPGQVSILDIPVSDTGVISQHADPIASEEEEAALTIEVLGPRWVRAGAGDTLRLECVAKGKMLPDLNHHARIHTDPLMSWTLDGIPITSFWSHTKVRVRELWSESRVQSEVLVRGLHPSDGGTYSCNSGHAPPDRVTVTVDPHGVEGAPKMAMSGRGDWPASDASWGDPEEASDTTGAVAAAGSARTAAVLSGAIILVLLLVQAALCIFYIKKV